MATTESGIYYQDDYNVPADILADMKKMAESTDKVIKENKYNDTPIKTDLQAIKQEQQDQNIKIENNTVESKDNAELLNQIMGLLPSAKGQGEYVTLQDTAEARFKKFEVQGNSKQETRSGKNLANITSITPYNINANLNNSEIIINGTSLNAGNIVINTNNATDLILKANKNYSISVIGEGIINASSYLNLYSRLGKNNINIGTLKSNNTLTYEYKPIEDIVLAGFNLDFGANNTFSNYKIKIQVEEGIVPTDYEEYRASPSPEFLSKIRNVGDNVNWFNKDGNVIISVDTEKTPIETGAKVTVKVKGAAKYCVMKLGGSELLGKTFILHGEARFSGKNDGLIGLYFGTESNFNIQWITDTNYLTIESSKFKRVFTVPDTFPEGSDTIYILLYANARSRETKVGDYVDYTDLKIEERMQERMQATAYSPHGCGNTEVTVYNKNLYDNKNANVLNSPIDSNGIGTNAGDTYKTIYIPCKPNTTYTVSKLYDVAKNRFALGYTNTEPTYSMQVEGYISNANVSNLTITTGKNAKYLLAYVWITGGTNTYQEMLSSIQIEENAEATNKIENKQQTIVFPFTEGQRLYKGDYLADDGIHHTRKQIVLDGTENWELDSMGGTETCICYKCIINNYKGYNSFAPIGELMCNYLEEKELYSNEQEGIEGGWGQYIFLKVKKDILETPDFPGFKKWIAKKKAEGNPVLIEYPLIQEVVDPYTPEQQEAYNQLKKLYSYNEQTNIFSTDEISPVFNVEAIKNLNATFTQLSATMLERS